MEREALASIKLVSLHFEIGEFINGLTFKFSNGVISPPKGSYFDEPYRWCKVYNKTVRKVIFGLHKYTMQG